MSKKKSCWVATEVKGGWRVKLCIGNIDLSSKGMVIKTVKGVENFCNSINSPEQSLGIVFVHLKNTKFPVR